MASDVSQADIKKLLDDITKEVEDSGEDVDDIKDDIETIKKEVVDSGDDVDEIKVDIKALKKEVEDSGDDFDEIKDELKLIRKEIAIDDGEGLLKRTFKRVMPDEFRLDDLAQQIVGAAILSAPFAVTEEVWRLAEHLDYVRVLLILLITVTFDVILFYYTKFQKIENKKILNFVPLRIFVLLIVTYTVSTIMLTVFGVLGGEVTDLAWSLRLIVLVGLFANVGAGTFDILK